VEPFHLFQILVITPNAALRLHLVGGAHIMLELSSNNLQMVVQWNNMPSSTQSCECIITAFSVCVCVLCVSSTDCTLLLLTPLVLLTDLKSEVMEYIIKTTHYQLGGIISFPHLFVCMPTCSCHRLLPHIMCTERHMSHHSTTSSTCTK